MAGSTPWPSDSHPVMLAVLRLARPATLVPPMTGVAAGAFAALGAGAGALDAGRLAAGVAAAALLNAASNVLNAVADRRADAANKPDRPLTSGALSARAAVIVAATTGGVGLVLAWLAAPGYLACALGAGACTAAYSCPPLRLKRDAVTAGLAIAVARGLLLVAAGWAIVATLDDRAPWLLGGCFALYLFGAAATKDFADVAGDRADGVRTWPVRLGPVAATWVVAPFLVLPWLALPWLAAAGPDASGLALASLPTFIGAAVCLALGVAGAATLWRDPTARTGENHPSWLLMYAQLVIGHVTVAVAALAAAAAGAGGPLPARRLIVIGVDGADPRLLARYMAAGDCPTLAALAAGGAFRPLGTTEPPVSPVAWATMETGLPPAAHGIFGFVRRDPTTYLLHSGLVDVSPPPLALGTIPVGGPSVRNRRQGVPFWSHLRDAGLPVLAYWMPVGFPPAAAPPGEELAGLGVPDLRGTVGSYTLWDSALPAEAPERTEFGGMQHPLALRDGVAESVLAGPPDPASPAGAGRRRLTIPITFAVAPGPGGPAVRIAWPDGTVVLAPGAPSGWLPVRFPLRGLLRWRSIPGRVRFFVRDADARVRVVASALQMDLADPPVPLTAPARHGARLAARHGPGTDTDLGKTAGWSEETFACQECALTDVVVLEDCLADIRRKGALLADRLRTTRWACAVAVFTELDRVSHCFWRYTDPSHPAHDPAATVAVPDPIRAAYRAMDRAIGEVRRAAPDATLLVCSDHGFRTWHTAVNLNAWLRREGWLHLREGATGAPRAMGGLGTVPGGLPEVDWARTRAYAIELGAIYLNLRGREGRGIVPPADAPAVRRLIAAGLRELRDPRTGFAVVRQVLDRDAAGFAPDDPEAPDLLVGFAEGYRVSWQTALGGIPEPVFEPNARPWSGDHVSAPASEIPGIWISGVPISGPDPTLLDIAPTVLRFYGQPVPPELRGRAFALGD